MHCGQWRTILRRESDEPMSEQPTQFTCFHCWESFDASTLAGQRAAHDHFGWTAHADPACKIKQDEGQLMFRIRVLEEQLGRYRAEDSDADRAIYAMQA